MTRTQPVALTEYTDSNTDSRNGQRTQSVDWTVAKMHGCELCILSSVARDDVTLPWEGPACGHVHETFYADKLSQINCFENERNTLLTFAYMGSI